MTQDLALTGIQNLGNALRALSYGNEPVARGWAFQACEAFFQADLPGFRDAWRSPVSRCEESDPVALLQGLVSASLLLSESDPNEAIDLASRMQAFLGYVPGTLPPVSPEWERAPEALVNDKVAEVLGQIHFEILTLRSEPCAARGRYWYCPVCSAHGNEPNLVAHLDGCRLVALRALVMEIS